VRSVSRRTYDQYCALARALDVLGERWSLLVIRELLVGPKRFSDLQDGLAGIGANALSARLKALEADGLVAKRRLPPPAASTVYELTERGRALEPTMLELARWGMPLLGSPTPGESFRPGWLLIGLRAVFDPERAAGVRLSCVLRVDGQAFTARIHDGAIDVVQEEDPAPDLALSLDPDTMLAIGAGELSAEEALDQGRLEVEKGEREQVLAFAAWLSLPAGAPA
jgi:DNA-binding HxlR family transcriptional regulator